MPCKNQGKLTVYSQHRSHFQKLTSAAPTDTDDREPLQAWMEDFAKEVQTWSEAGEKIIIHMDANSDVRTRLVAKTLRPLGFEEKITFRHGNTHPPPATHMVNTS